MMRRPLSLQGPRPYLFSIYLALAAFLVFLLYTLDRSGFSIQITYDASTSFPTKSQPSPNLEIKDKVAVIIENRALSPLIPLLLHFASVLGPSWPIILYTSQSAIPDSAAFRRLIDTHALSIRFLPPSITFKSRDDVSAFLTKPWLYEQLAPAEHMLLFQSDSILCAKSEARVDDFFKYDFVGAPINQQYGQGYNGGLSLRNRTMMLDIINSSDWEKESTNTTDAGLKFEDQWFYKKLLNYTGAKLPSVEEAGRFAVETIWAEKPLGYHQIKRWFGGRLAEVDKWCPEHRLVVGDQIAN